MKHTPGPWKIKKDLGGYLDLFGEDGDKILISKFRLINQEANAALIAAAPDLLRALEPIANAEKDPTLKGYWRVTDLFVETALVAIAKAKGE